MKEEKNEEIQVTTSDELTKLKKGNSSKTVTIIILSFIIVLMLVVIILYILNNKEKEPSGNNGGNPTSTPQQTTGKLSNDEAIKIAKEKIEMANKLSEEDKCFEEDREKEDGTNWCYYGSLDDFKNKFYSIYSSRLSYKDVMVEYKSIKSTTDWSSNIISKGDWIDSIPGYVINNSKIYRDSCTIGSGFYNRMDKFTIESITTDTIKLNYVVIEKDTNFENSEETEGDKASIILVKEGNDWKILKATIVDMCNGVYTVGKES